MKKGIAAVILFWLCIVGISLWWNLRNERREDTQLAFETARAFFQQILITRAWNASHGGVYVPVTKAVQPNLYLEDPQRDLVTEQGIRLTKINPAYMTRQIAEMSARYEGIHFHITSLNPIRPQNRATSWEKPWLESLERGAAEQGEFISEGSETSFRYMAPLLVEESCLKCHAKQGYTKGQIRGAISITIPYLRQQINTKMLIGYGIIALVGTIFTLIGGTMLSRKQMQLMDTNEALKHGIAEREKLIGQLREAYKQIKTLSGIVPICMYCKEIRDDKGYWNQLEKFISEHSEAKFSHSICPKCMKEKHPDIMLDDE